MNNVIRGPIFFLATLLLGAYAYASAFDLDRNGVLGAIMFSTVVDWTVFVVLPVLAVAVMGRWWALSLALVPFAVQFYLHEATDYVYPFHEDPYPALVVSSTVILFAIYSLGFLLRAAFNHTVAARRARTLRTGSAEA